MPVFYLDSTESVEKVGIVADACTDPTAIMLALMNELQNFFFVHLIKRSH